MKISARDVQVSGGVGATSLVLSSVVQYYDLRDVCRTLLSKVPRF